MFSLEGKTALVTGAGFGMGAGVAGSFASQGAHVIVNDLDKARAEEVVAALLEQGFAATAAPFDVTNEQAVQDGISAASAAAGPIDILVNNAGNAGGSRFVQKSFAEMSADDWGPFLAVNLLGVMHCTKAVLQGMCDRGYGRVITISSEAARIALPIGVSVYGAAKAGAAQLMRYVAVEVAQHGVTANNISLGNMNTIGEAFASEVVKGIPTGRLGTPEDVAAAAVFLASSEAAWITGATLAVNGGLPAIQ
jgi:NAD(P)-dependent dehydrogenase (short-subunit alcohol dehydrogenase family)